MRHRSARPLEDVTELPWFPELLRRSECGSLFDLDEEPLTQFGRSFVHPNRVPARGKSRTDTS